MTTDPIREALQRWKDGYGFNEDSDADVELAERVEATLAQPRPEQVEDEAEGERIKWAASIRGTGLDPIYKKTLLVIFDHPVTDEDRSNFLAAINAFTAAERAALARPAPKPAGDVVSAYWNAAQIAYRVCAETRHVSLAVKARDAILAASPAPANAAPASVVSHELAEHETQLDLCPTHETQTPASEREGA
jgi:hypothetical protein